MPSTFFLRFFRILFGTVVSFFWFVNAMFPVWMVEMANDNDGGSSRKNFFFVWSSSWVKAFWSKVYSRISWFVHIFDVTFPYNLAAEKYHIPKHYATHFSLGGSFLSPSLAPFFRAADVFSLYSRNANLTFSKSISMLLSMLFMFFLSLAHSFEFVLAFSFLV